jgi:hypothetical protein
MKKERGNRAMNRKLREDGGCGNDDMEQVYNK